ncbi:MAG TPA: Ig-like domain-containing protein [Woeseiaceae bacterium]|nr:Ig-like domain-containing protein [Woeseiaceae bacterium]
MTYRAALLLGALIAGCGGGGDDDELGIADSSNIGWVDIREPIIGNGSYTTTAPVIEISGTAFVSPADVDCIAVKPAQLTLTWQNESTGQGGTGGIASYCRNTFLGLLWGTQWTIPAGAIDLQFGENVITIAAADNAGNRGTATITVVRVQDVVAPVILDSSPAPDAVDVPVNRSITVTFSESMLRSSLTADRLAITDPDGLEVSGFTSYDDRNFRWQFDPQFHLLYSSTYTVTVSGLVEDEFGGNPLGDDVSWQFTTAPNPDVTPPAVIEVSPNPGSACVSPGANVLARFDEPIDSSTVTDATVTLVQEGNNAIDAAVTYNGAAAVLDPLLPLLSGTRYEARLAAGITDLAGNALGADFSWSFTTTSDVANGAWLMTALSGAPFERRDHTAVWNGSEVIVWGGHGWLQSIGAFVDTDSGARYDPASDTWSAMSTDGVPAKSEHTAVMAGNEMFVWGGNTNTGFRYDPGTDTWTAMTTLGAPSARRLNAIAWTGTEMIVWGGESTSGSTLNTGARYNPATDTWSPMSTLNAPSPRRDMAYAWTGTEFIVWGGISAFAGGTLLTDGARYNPASDTWTPMAAGDAPGGTGLIAAWTGTEMIVWNGGLPSHIDVHGFPTNTPTLRFYDPAADSWRAAANLCEPYLGGGEKHGHWTGSRLFVWSNDENGGYFYDPAADSWQAIDTLGGPSARSGAASVWTGDRFVLWGGQASFGLQDTGFVFTE